MYHVLLKVITIDSCVIVHILVELGFYNQQTYTILVNIDFKKTNDVVVLFNIV